MCVLIFWERCHISESRGIFQPSNWPCMLPMVEGRTLCRFWKLTNAPIIYLKFSLSRFPLVWFRGIVCSCYHNDGTDFKAGEWFQWTYSLNPWSLPFTLWSRNKASFTPSSQIFVIVFDEIRIFSIKRLKYEPIGICTTSYCLNPMLMVPCPTEQELLRAFGSRTLCRREAAFVKSSMPWVDRVSKLNFWCCE